MESFAKKEYPPKPAIGQLFDVRYFLEKGEAFKEIEISPYEKAFAGKTEIIIVWSQGPSAGKVYNIIPQLPLESLENLPSIEAITEELGRSLRNMERLLIEREGVSEDVLVPLSELKADALTLIHTLYYGTADVPGLEYAQFCQTSPNAAGYQDFIRTINGVEKTAGYAYYLSSIAASLDLPRVAKLYSSPETNWSETTALNKIYYDGLESKGNNIYPDKENPILFSHQTDSAALASIIELGGLAGGNYLKEKGIQRQKGGETGGGDVHYSGAKISYWYKPRTIVGDYGDYQSKKGFEYPILFAIDTLHGEDLNPGFGYGLVGGRIQGERTISDYPDFLPLERITQVFVPSFKITEVESLFATHGYGHIQVKPLRQPMIHS